MRPRCCAPKLGPKYPGGFYTKEESEAFFREAGEKILKAIEEAGPPITVKEWLKERRKR